MSRTGNPDTVTHLSTNWARHRVTSMMCATPINQSINQFISRHRTEARATVRLCRIKEKCLKTGLKCVNGWSSWTVQWKRVPKSVTANKPSSPWTSSGSAHVTRSLRVTILYLYVREVHGQRARAVPGVELDNLCSELRLGCCCCWLG